MTSGGDASTARRERAHDVRKRDRPRAQGDGARAAGAALGRLDGEPGRCRRAACGRRRAPRRRRCRTAPASPTQAIEAPASVSDPARIAPGVADGATQQIVATASTNGIPSAALRAYQRAAQVIDAADAAATSSWQLIAAIGRVESNHGRVRRQHADDDGRRRRPASTASPLNGAQRHPARSSTPTPASSTTTRVYDRAVGPMQFIPSTWSVVGVDADGDGVAQPAGHRRRGPRTAVYLCSGDDDLGTEPASGRRSTATTTARTTSTWCSPIMEAYAAGRLHRRSRTSTGRRRAHHDLAAAPRARHGDPGRRTSRSRRPHLDATRRPRPGHRPAARDGDSTAAPPPRAAAPVAAVEHPRRPPAPARARRRPGATCRRHVRAVPTARARLRPPGSCATTRSPRRRAQRSRSPATGPRLRAADRPPASMRHAARQRGSPDRAWRAPSARSRLGRSAKSTVAGCDVAGRRSLLPLPRDHDLRRRHRRRGALESAGHHLDHHQHTFVAARP